MIRLGIKCNDVVYDECFTASFTSFTALANAASPLAHPFFRHGGMPVSPFYTMLHPGMFPWPPVPAPGVSALVPPSTEISSSASTGLKSEVQVNRTIKHACLALCFREDTLLVIFLTYMWMQCVY